MSSEASEQSTYDSDEEEASSSNHNNNASSSSSAMDDIATQSKNLFKSFKKQVKKLAGKDRSEPLVLTEAVFPRLHERIKARRMARNKDKEGELPDNVIFKGMEGLEGFDGDNINGPSMMVAPEWLPNRLGKYYLYFAHHKGKYIRLAYADSPFGPWTVKKGGTLNINQHEAGHDHVASPDVHVDNEAKVVHMLFHSPRRDGKGQRTYYASSTDGLKFQPRPNPLGCPYFRAFRHPMSKEWFALGKKGDKGQMIYRAKEIWGPYDEGPKILPRSRHTALLISADGKTLQIFFSRIGDKPEAIVTATMDISDPSNWEHWDVADCCGVLCPEFEFEGFKCPQEHSDGGQSMVPVHQLRDPCVTVLPPEDGGGVLLHYCTAGEKGIGHAALSLL